MDVKLRFKRNWQEEKHLRHLADGQWIPMLDSDGNVLPGIDGMHGVRDEKGDGTYIGADFVRMQHGTAFPLHSHHGDHEIYVIKGAGIVHINGKDVVVKAGHLIHIPAEYPHGISVPERFASPLIFVAMGHPHQHVDARNRMQRASYTISAARCGQSITCHHCGKTSYNQNDIAQRYCGWCNVFHEDRAKSLSST
jgi:quercetin dioxygenase-like cupin family protein